MVAPAVMKKRGNRIRAMPLLFLLGRDGWEDRDWRL
jgi:hypothetical protein